MSSEDSVLPPSPGPSPDAHQPWAFAINETALSQDIEVTLLSAVVVDEIVRIYGLVRIERRVDVGLSSVPTLLVTTPDMVTILPRTAHLLPLGPKAVWVSWIYQRPSEVLGTYEARIARIELTARYGRKLPESVVGSWVFAFGLSSPGNPMPAAPRAD